MGCIAKSVVSRLKDDPLLGTGEETFRRLGTVLGSSVQERHGLIGVSPEWAH